MPHHTDAVERGVQMIDWTRTFIPALGKVSAYGHEKNLRVRRAQKSAAPYAPAAKVERHPVSTARHYAGSFLHIRALYAPIRGAA